jgi:hypothetical protein
MAIGAALIVPLVVRSVTSVADSVNAESHRAPASLREDLDAGRYVVFERTGSTHSAGPFSATQQGPPTLVPSDVVVTGPDGRPEPTSFDQANETITRGSSIFTGVVVFDAPTDGTYQIEIRGDGQEVLLSPSLGETFRKLGPLFLLAVAGGLLFLTGVVLLVVGIVRRGRRQDVAAPAPGWHPDPSGGGGLRYWDGARWTEHTSP